MEIKKINWAFLILACLIFTSFAFYVGAENKSSTTSNIFLDSDQDGLTDAEEKLYGTNPHNPDTDGDGYTDGAEVRAGYDPLKPAPNDKIIPGAGNRVSANTDSQNSGVLGDSTEKNLTTDITQKITDLTTSADPNKTISMDDVQSLVDQSISGTDTNVTLPEVNKADLKIIKQNYAGLSDKKAQEKKKEDFSNYIATIIYIFASNSPTPITSLTDASSVVTQIKKTVITAVTTQDTSGLKDLATSQGKIVEQLKAVAVPEDLVDLHIKALQFALYSQNLITFLQPKNGDPIGDIANLSKVTGFLTAFSDFTTEVESKFSEYGLDYNSTIQSKLKSYGIDAPDNLKDVSKLLTN